MDSLLRRLAVLVEIADRKSKSGSATRLGKTAMQKLVYLLQEGLDVKIGYRFSLYTYGPYDARVMSDLDYAVALGLLELEYDANEGYQIRPGANVDSLQEERQSLGSDDGAKLDQLFTVFGGLTARKLELRATLLYIVQEEPPIVEDESGLLERIRALKPKYDERELAEAIEHLKQEGFFKLSNEDSMKQRKGASERKNISVRKKK